MKVEEWICVPAQTQAGTQAPGEDKQTPTKESVAGQDADNESVTAQDADNESVTAQEADKVPGKADEQNGGANQKDNKICADAADLILQDCKKGLRSDNIVGLEACTEAAEKERQKCLAPNKKKAGGPFTISDVCRRTARDFMDNCRKNKTEIAELKKCGNEAREILQACQEKEKAQKGAEGQQGPEKEKTQDEEEGQQCQGEATR
ncbi:hypothetical protein MGU_11425 [Metarhizium guizhouense ARSEF 977]|uniref:Uncharacterized protein n=1 Tax=Metarhizium guizhouense (strain ARSEF 977) TaxID=1276136 RepID=A0A0B4GUM6_METGA|nr:hypothetical protein MGU_11425 [Metarhizium guizhouense ARSEF 977]